MIAIAAMSLNRVIGAKGQIPWHLPDDLKFFKRVTLGHIVLMGRKTYESIGRPLPGRENWIVSRSGLRSAEEPAAGLRTFGSLAEIPRVSPDGREIFLIGGAQLYEALLPECAVLYLTLVNRTIEGDAYFPKFESSFSKYSIESSGEEYEIRKYVR